MVSDNLRDAMKEEHSWHNLTIEDTLKMLAPDGNVLIEKETWLRLEQHSANLLKETK